MADILRQKNYNYHTHLSLNINQDAEQWGCMKNKYNF